MIAHQIAELTVAVFYCGLGVYISQANHSPIWTRVNWEPLLLFMLGATKLEASLLAIYLH